MPKSGMEASLLFLWLFDNLSFSISHHTLVFEHTCLHVQMTGKESYDMKGTYPVPPHGKETWKQLQEVAKFGYSSSEVFTDFVEAVLACLLSMTFNLEHSSYEQFRERVQNNAFVGEYEDRYMRIVNRYKENKTRKPGSQPADYFKNAWAALQVETEASQKDVLGDLYESQISLGEHGQFFSPESLAQVLNTLLGSHEGERVLEPACGSGRLLIQAAKENPYRRFVGIDKSPICARMAVLNMWLFGINADIYQGNTLSMEMSYLWHIRGEFIWEYKIENGVVASPASVSAPIQKSQAVTTPAQAGATKQKKKPVPKRQKAGETIQQRGLFDLDE